MSETADAKQAIQGDHVNDTESNVAGEQKRTQPHLMPLLPIVLGVFIIGLNVFVTLRLWTSAYRSNMAFLRSFNHPTTVAFSVITISLGIGLILIAYAIVLRRNERHGPADSDQVRSSVPAYVRWVIVPALVALPAPALTVWAAEMIEPIAPTPCIELYQQAANIKKDIPNFKMYYGDRDQLRCAINQTLAE